MKVVVADIGGTQSRFWLCGFNDGAYIKLYEQFYESANFSGFSILLKQFLEDAALKVEKGENGEGETTIDAMCLALPGVIKQRKTRLTNLDWEINADELQTRFTIPKVILVNDFQAAAMGVTTLKEEDTIVLNSASTEDKGITVVTGAGTGLGMSWMDNTQGHLQLFATEGGHCDFAPTNDQQIALLKFLQKQYDHVSYERILSGPGLVQLYAFINPGDETVANTAIPVMAKKINDAAKQGHPPSLSAIRLFVEIYAAYIGNLALLFKPTGGIYIAGGIATHIIAWMQEKEFITSYLHKGRMQGLAEQTPVYLVTNNRLGLQGAMQLAINELS